MIDEDGYLYIMARTDDVINVAGHRLSTGAMEEVLANHPDVAECAVIGVADELKGQLPVGFVCLTKGVNAQRGRSSARIIDLVRREIGPVAAFKLAVLVDRLPKTRSGKILRATMVKLANGEDFKMPATIDDPAILDEIKRRWGASAAARRLRQGFLHQGCVERAGRRAPQVGARRRWPVTDELFADQAFLQPMTGVEQQPVLDVRFRADLDPFHVAHRLPVGLGHDRAPLAIEHVEANERVFGTSAPRQRRGRNAAMAVIASTSEPIGRIGPWALVVVGRRARRRRHEGTVADQFLQPCRPSTVMRSFAACGPSRSSDTSLIASASCTVLSPPRLHPQRVDHRFLGLPQPVDQPVRRNIRSSGTPRCRNSSRRPAAATMASPSACASMKPSPPVRRSRPASSGAVSIAAATAWRGPLRDICIAGAQKRFSVRSRPSVCR